MKNYLISYDLHKQGQDYKSLTEALGKYPNARKLLQSVWFVHPAKSSIEIRDHLYQFMDSNDHIIVVEIAKGNSAWGLEENLSRFLKHSL